MEMNVAEFDKIARDIFNPAYTALAEQIKSATGITQGVCLDAGSGGGYLSIALAKVTSLDIILLDQSEDMQKIADRNIVQAGLEKRLYTIQADIHKIPLDNCSVNVVVSRGSIFFWEDHVKAFSEIYRVLAPGGVTFIGGGFGSVAIKKKIDEQMLALDKSWLDTTGKRMNDDTMARFREALHGANVPYELKMVEAGFGIMIRKDIP